MDSSQATSKESNMLLEEQDQLKLIEMSHIEEEKEDEDHENGDNEEVETEKGAIIEKEAEMEAETGTKTTIAKKRKIVTDAKDLRSEWWKFYSLVFVEEGNPPVSRRKGKCNGCETLIAADAHLGTNGLKNHVKSCPKNKGAVAGGQTILNFKHNADGTPGGELTSWRFDQKAIRLALCEMIIIDELPFIFVEREGFKRLVERMCPQFKIPSRVTIRADCMMLFLEHKDRVKSFFQKKGMGMASITTDCWTAVNNTNFICVTAHCIGKDWVLHKKIISFRKIASHKGNDIGDSIITSLRDWELKKILCCTVDNASANDAAVKYVNSYLQTWKTDILGGKYLHMRCAAHILNLVVQDGLEDIGLSVRRVREAVKWIRGSPLRSAQFQACVELLRDRINCKKELCQDVPTRWNSTYEMLESAQPYEEAFNIFGTMYPAYANDLKQKKYKDLSIGPPEAIDWFNVKKMSEYLKKFYELTLIVSGTKYPTSHLLFVEMCDIFDMISKLELNNDPEVVSMAKKMRLKIGKYWKEEDELNPKVNRIIYIAALLDPRQKMKHVEKCLKAIYGVERAATLVVGVRDSVKEMFELYKKQKEMVNATTTRSDRTVVRRQERSDHQGALSLQNMGESDEESDNDDFNELNLYLTEKQHKMPKQEIVHFDILSWWKRCSPRYPILSDMARDILAIPISSVASESAFSTGGRVLCAYRSSLVPNMVEALICAEDWLKSNSVEKKYEEGVPEDELQREFERVLGNLGVGMAESSTGEVGVGPSESESATVQL